MKKAVVLLAVGFLMLAEHAVGQVRLDRGKELFDQGKISEALPIFQAIINNTQRDYQAWYWLAKSHQKLGNLDSAEIAIRRVIQIEDEFQEAYVLLISILIEKKDLPDAYTTARKGIKAKKQDYQPLYLSLGDLLLKMDSADVALVAFSRARELDPTSIAAYVGEGEVYLKQGVIPMAAQRFEKALEVDSLQPQLLYRLANVYLKDRQYNDAARTYLRLIIQMPKNDDARLELGNLYYRAKQWTRCAATLKEYFSRVANPSTEVVGKYMEALFNSRQYADAIPVAERFVKADPTSVVGARILAQTQHFQKHHVQAVESYAKLETLDTLTVDDLTRLGRSYRELKKDSLAAMTYERALTIDTTQASLFGEAGTIWMNLKDWDRAAAMFQKRFLLDTTAIAAYINYGMCMMQEEKFEEAAAAFEQAIRQKPDYPPSYTSLASCYFAMKKLDLGRQAAEKAIQVIDTAKTKYRLELADAYRLIGLSFLLDKKWEDGVKNLRESLKYKEDAPQTWLLIAQGLQNMQKNKEAYEAYKRVLKYDPKNAAALEGVKVLKTIVE